MKTIIKITLLAFIIAIPGILFAQINPLDNYIEKYEGTPGFYYMDMKTNMFNFDDKEEGSQETSSKIIDFKIVSFEKNENSKFNPTQIYTDFNTTLNKDVYKYYCRNRKCLTDSCRGDRY